MEITFLGTGSMLPTKMRNHSAILITHHKYGLLFDCGEGTQRQIQFIKTKHNKIDVICISHWHGDHCLGLPGLIETLGSLNYTKTLHIYGPTGTKKHLKAMQESYSSGWTIPINAQDIEEGTIYENEEFTIEANKLIHNVESYGFRLVQKEKRRIDTEKLKEKNIPPGAHLKLLQENKTAEFKGKKLNPKTLTYIVPGKVISYISDTGMCLGAEKTAKNADLLISESTFDASLELDAKKYNHLTSKQAAQIAKKSKAKQLILTHFSQRYTNTKQLVDEAKEIFPKTSAAFDLLQIKL